VNERVVWMNGKI